MTHCWLCVNVGGPYDGNDNHEFNNGSSCHCWFCTDCLEEMYHEDVTECHVCTGDIEDLVACNAYYTSSSDSDSCSNNMCRVCERFPEYHGNPNLDIESNCQHWFCGQCLIEFYEDGVITCPLCQGDIEELVGDTYRWAHDDTDDDMPSGPATFDLSEHITNNDCTCCARAA